MLWRDISQQIATLLGGNLALADERPFIYIDTKRQCLQHVYIDPQETVRYPISTAAAGLGNRLDSFKTPFGIHRIKQKIGGGESSGMIFKAREPTGRISTQTDNQDKDEITSRILWLDGMEKSTNLGGVYDTFSRYIYIHGTSDEKRIGQAVSLGCIRMKNKDVIELFDEALVNDLVFIK
ncbi:MAG: lipoprotein-anchoring transpeptidase ErfK/SrfK [Gammaproteobacteria bacterium]|jgi:lipoprotein-anchoring transpeptidase ErfK/SrfK